ncbi:nucleotidyltransferase substrate binding protein [Pricia sp. S334]|uniref:Nucleotidyltransferase substrate binding protein n=1 Tax=Pricia mediterranea TaxID=3076079 RepID=A0ABU3L6A5_9FLAO|nr:nucleotidyltransferase substrate binding protein [Pricia sp. S334]MDT7829264.1 nucleotidyltransferase substrate binding protein [Pricia sp. S334]
MKANDVRWKQRFSNFERSLNFLKDALAIEKPDIVQKAGLIQFFEMSFELSWKVMKDYLQEQGFSELRFPRETIKMAFESDLISDGHTWLEALKNRNLTSHTYDEEIADKVVALIRNSYYGLLEDLSIKLKSEL